MVGGAEKVAPSWIGGVYDLGCYKEWLPYLAVEAAVGQNISSALFLARYTLCVKRCRGRLIGKTPAIALVKNHPQEHRPPRLISASYAHMGTNIAIHQRFFRKTYLVSINTSINAITPFWLD